jgi:small subunit ribosomal protein S1
VVFTMGRKPMSPSMRKLKEAFESKIPVQGHVRATNKGGFEVGLPGARAFCPFSQIEIGYCEKPEEYVGRRFPFVIITFERNGKNIVVSRRHLLQEEAKEAAKKTRERLAVDAVFEGVVRRLQPYGAFVDIGGIDGLVHVSQIRHGHVGDPREVLHVGDKVQVKVLKIEEPGSKKERISLSMKDLVPDPWDTVEEQLPAGQPTVGKVVRLTDFGAFVELLPGVDGLIHISEIANERIGHPSEVLQVGQEVQPRVLSVDRTSQRISLSLREKQDAPPRPRRSKEPSRSERDGAEEMHYRAEERPRQGDVDVTQMEYADALEVLKRKFNRGR